MNAKVFVEPSLCSNDFDSDLVDSESSSDIGLVKMWKCSVKSPSINLYSPIVEKKVDNSLISL